jgi:SET domain-containing protein
MVLVLVIDNIQHTCVKSSSLHGNGLFATRSLKKDVLLCILSGQMMSDDEYHALIKQTSFPRELFMEKFRIDESRIAITPFRTKYSYINHSDEPNIYSNLVGHHLHVFASVDINFGEEILDKYNLKKHIDVLGGFSAALLLAAIAD